MYKRNKRNKKMNIRFNVIEEYPVYTIAEKNGKIDKNYPHLMNVNKKTVERWEKVYKEFRQIQDEIYKAVDGNTN